MAGRPPSREVPARDRILDAVLELIADEGVASVSNRRVAAAASVSLGSLTYHFPSQQNLLREALRRYVRREIDRIEAIAKNLRARHLDPRRLGAEIERHAALRAAGPELLAELELHLAAARDPELQEASRECFEAYQKLAEAAMTVLGVPDPDRHSTHVVDLMMGSGLRRLGTGARDADDLGDALQTIARGASARARATTGPAD